MLKVRSVKNINFAKSILREAFKKSELLDQPDRHVIGIGMHCDVILKDGSYRILEDDKEVLKFTFKDTDKWEIIRKIAGYKYLLDVVA
jgi:hypothetical protein